MKANFHFQRIEYLQHFGRNRMKRSFTMFPQVMTVVGSYMHPVGQAAGRPICWIEEAFAFALSRDLFFLANISIFTVLHLHLNLLDWSDDFALSRDLFFSTDLLFHLPLPCNALGRDLSACMTFTFSNPDHMIRCLRTSASQLFEEFLSRGMTLQNL